MSETVIKVENLSKQYRLGMIGTGTASQDLKRWWAGLRGKEDPFAIVGEANDLKGKKLGKNELIWALKDINFEVKRGEVLGIIGKNGAGKSTLLKILSQVTAPTTGTVKVKGRIASLLEVGTGFHPELSGRENIFLNGAILGMSKNEIRDKFDEIVDFSGVERYIDTPVKRYSSGMYVRLAFAVAAHLEPEILIVDEVLAVGDAEFQRKCLGKMKDVAGQGRTVLFVSHNMDAISSLTFNSIYLIKGKLRGIGKTSEIIRDYIETNNSKEVVYNSNKDNLHPHIKRVELKTSLPNNVQLNGDRMEVLVDLFSPKPLKSACFSFQFVDLKDRNFVHSWVFDSTIPYCREKGTYQLSCSIKSLKLYLGNYKLKCFFSEPPGGELFEFIEGICPFEVVMYDTKRSDFQWHPEACAYIEDSEWKVKLINNN